MGSIRMLLRDEVLTMKRAVLLLVALLAGIVPAKSQTAPGQPASAASNTVQRAAKLTLKQPWEDVTIRLVIPASLQAAGRTENLKAKVAVYGDKLPRFPVLAAEDPYRNRAFISDYFAHGVYLSEPSWVTVFGIGPGGPLVWNQSYVEMTGSSGKLKAAIRQFETQFDDLKLKTKREKMDPFVAGQDAQGRLYPKRRPNANRIELAPAGLRHFFTGPDAHSDVFFPLIDKAEKTQGVLRLEIRNRVAQNIARFWIDLEARKVVKCVADGKELDFSVDRSGLFLPQKVSQPDHK